MNDLLANFSRALITAVLLLCGFSIWCTVVNESVDDLVIQRPELDRENLLTSLIEDAYPFPLIRLVGQQSLPSTSLTSTFSRMIEQVVVDKVIETVVPVPKFVPLAERIGNGLYIKLDDSWQAEVRSSVLAVLHESADAIYSHMKDRPLIKITVTYDLEEGPIALYKVMVQIGDGGCGDLVPLSFATISASATDIQIKSSPPPIVDRYTEGVDWVRKSQEQPATFF